MITPGIRDLELAVFLFDGPQDIFRSFCTHELLAKRRIAKKAGDAGKRLEMFPARVLRHHEKKEELGGFAVDGIEVETLGTTPKRSDEPR